MNRRLAVCFVSSARYGRPLDPTQAKKWQALATLGEMFVIGFSADGEPRRFTEHAHFYLLPRLPVPLARYLLLLAAGGAVGLWLLLTKGVRAVVAQGPYEGLAAVVVKKIGRLFGKPIGVIVESHGDFEGALFLQRRVRFPQLQRRAMRAAARWVLSQADVLRAISSATEAQLRAWAPGKPVVCFPTWTDIELFWAAGAVAGPRSSEVVYAGVLTPLKGVHLLLEAFRRIADALPDARLRLIGRRENEDYVRRLEAEVHRARLAERVAFVGEVSQAALAEEMARARVVVLPSLSEGLGRVAFEAMAAGRPVIASAVGGTGDVVEDGVTGFLVPPGDVEALADRLAPLLRHPDQADEMGRRGRAFAARFFSSAGYVQGYARLLEAAGLEHT